MNYPKAILITGASSGIGAALAVHYAAAGISLYLSGRNPERLEDIAKRCRDKGAIVQTVLLDVTDRQKMAEWIIGIYQDQPLDLVIANAGISGGTGGAKEGESFAAARQIFAVNLTGVLNTIEPAITQMITQNKGGQIAIISSLAGFRGWTGAPAYSASKGAVRFYGEALRGSLKPAGIAVNVVCPGFVTSRMTDVNDYPMPFMMGADQAARLIAKGLQRNQGRICFPFPVHFMAWLIGILPDPLAQWILSRLPPKPAITKPTQNDHVIPASERVSR